MFQTSVLVSGSKGNAVVFQRSCICSPSHGHKLRLAACSRFIRASQYLQQRMSFFHIKRFAVFHHFHADASVLSLFGYPADDIIT